MADSEEAGPLKYIRVGILIPDPCFFAAYVVGKIMRSGATYKLTIRINMFWIRKEVPIYEDVKRFENARVRFTTTKSQVRHIMQFIRITGVTRFEDITEDLILAYSQSAKYSLNRESEQLEVNHSLLLFMRQKRLEERFLLKRDRRGRPAKELRNAEMILLRAKNYTYDDIAARYKMNKKTVYEIINRKI